MLRTSNTRSNKPHKHTRRIPTTRRTSTQHHGTILQQHSNNTGRNTHSILVPPTSKRDSRRKNTHNNQQTAQQTYEYLSTTLILENKTIDFLIVYDEIPYSGVDFNCQPRTWSQQEVY